MRHQQVSVDYEAMAKAMLKYLFLAAMGWLMLRMFNTVFMLPRRMRNQHQTMQQTLEELQKRYPGLNITEEDMKEAEKEFEEIMKEHNEKKDKTDKPIEKSNGSKDEEQKSAETAQVTEDKKTI